MVAPRDWTWPQGEDAGWAALGKQRWIIREPGSSSRVQFEQLVLPLLGETPATLTFNTSEAIVHAVGAGLGCALVSALAVRERVDDGELLRLSLPPRLSRPLTVVRLASRYLAPRAAEVLAWLSGKA